MSDDGPVDLVRCPSCHRDSPDLQFCVRCGHELSVSVATDGRRSGRRQFAAAPDQRVWVPHLVGTLFPQLPRADMRSLGVAVTIGAAAIAILATAGFYPLALALACLLLPVVVLLYLFAVDIYEREPAKVLAATTAWGAVAGVVLGFWVRRIHLPIGGSGWQLLQHSPGVTLVVVLPLVGTLVALAAPLGLLRYRNFNDVLDGITFGAASAVTLIGVQTLVGSAAALGLGFRPAGSAWPWLERLAAIGLFVPVIWACTGGLACSSLWLRFRAPVGDRRRLGPLRFPALAIGAAVVVNVGSAVVVLVLPRLAGVIVVAVVALGALVALRQAIHLGLLEEANEIEIGPEMVCPNCHRSTPRHTFCGQCGVSLKALPEGARPSRLGGVRLLAGLAVVMVLVVAVSMVAVWRDRPPAPVPRCPSGLSCVGADTPVSLALGVRWTSTSLGFSFEHEPGVKVVATNSSNSALVLQAEFSSGALAQVRVSAVPAGSATPDAMLDAEHDLVAKLALGLQPETSDFADRSTAVTDLGFVNGIGAGYTGVADPQYGPSGPMSVTIVAASNGHLTAATTVVIYGAKPADIPDLRDAVSGLIFDTFRWGP